MKATLNGKNYDTEEASQIAGCDSPDGQDTLYETAEGEFFLRVGSTYLDGRKLQPCEHPYDLAPSLRGKGRKALQERLDRLRFEPEIVPLTERQAMIWCIKTQLPECFRGYVLESI